MKALCIDCEHEKDLERKINEFLQNNKVKIEHIKYAVSNFTYKDEQIFSFSVIIIYSNVE